MPWTFKHGQWYFRVPKSKRAEWDNKTWFPLGRTAAEAYKTWYLRLEYEAHHVRTMGELFDSYEAEVLSTKAERTQESYRGYMKKLRIAFSHMAPHEIMPRHCHQYMRKRNAAPVAANREISVLISVMGYGVRIGVLDFNQLKGQIERNPEKPRERAPSADELDDFLSDAHPQLKGFIGLKRITGARQGQLLAIVIEDQWDGKRLLIPKAKGGKDVYYKGWYLEVVMEYILYRRGARRLPVGNLFLNRHGRPWSRSGLKSMFRRQMDKFIARGGERFNEHDIRAYVVGELEDDFKRASMMLGHSDDRTARRIYHRKAVEVEVLER